MKPHGNFREGGVDTANGPGNIYYEKLVYRMSGLASAAPGTRINCHGAGEIAVFADHPVNIQIGDSPKVYLNKTQFRLRGRVGWLNVTRAAAFGVGRLVVFLGDPFLGVNFKREDPRYMISTPINPNFGNWAVAPTASITSSNTTLPFGGDGPMGVSEAVYIKNIYIGRLVAGTIESVAIEETESGVAVRVFFDVVDNPTDQYIWHAGDFPFRIPSEFQVELSGSTEAVVSAVEAQFQVVVV
jgi:hypothetical protein